MALKPTQTFEKFSEFLSERFSQRWIPKPQFRYPPLRSCVALRGFALRGLGDVRGFSLLRWEKGSETPSCGGQKGSETPSFLMLRPRERASLRPLFPPQEGVSDPFSHRKRENLVHPPNPLAQIPLAQRIIRLGYRHRISRERQRGGAVQNRGGGGG